MIEPKLLFQLYLRRGRPSPDQRRHVALVATEFAPAWGRENQTARPKVALRHCWGAAHSHEALLPKNNSNGPGFPALPSDVLNVDLTGVTNAQLTAMAATAGTFSFGNRDSVQYAGMETVNVVPASGTCALIFNMVTLGFGAGLGSTFVILHFPFFIAFPLRW